MKILVLNAGSSSIKYQLFEMNDNRVLASGLIEKIGENASLKHIIIEDILLDIIYLLSSDIDILSRDLILNFIFSFHCLNFGCLILLIIFKVVSL